MDIIPVAVGAFIALVITSLYTLIETALRKRVSIRSPEADSIAQMVPAVNALMDMQGPQTTALIAILEAQKGICNGNVDSALEVTKKAKSDFDKFLLGQARIQA